MPRPVTPVRPATARFCQSGTAMKRENPPPEAPRPGPSFQAVSANPRPDGTSFVPSDGGDLGDDAREVDVALAVVPRVVRKLVRGAGVAGRADERDPEQRAGLEELARLVVTAGRREPVLGHSPRDRHDARAARLRRVEEGREEVHPARVDVRRPPQVHLGLGRRGPHPVHVERDLDVRVAGLRRGSRSSRPRRRPP